MTPGRLIRTILGAHGSRVAAHAYRALFVDIGKVIDTISRQIPNGAYVLDVGGGDGAIVNLLLAQRADIRVTTIDVAPIVGQWIDSVHQSRVVKLPATTLAQYVASNRPRPDVLLLTDVMHHIPVAERESFLASVAKLTRATPSTRIIVKDVEPGHWRADLGYLSDRYVTGDRSVSPVSRNELVAAMQRVGGAIHWTETELFAIDRPNYALVFWR